MARVFEYIREDEQPLKRVLIESEQGLALPPITVSGGVIEHLFSIGKSVAEMYRAEVGRIRRELAKELTRHWRGILPEAKIKENVSQLRVGPYGENHQFGRKNVRTVIPVPEFVMSFRGNGEHYRIEDLLLVGASTWESLGSCGIGQACHPKQYSKELPEPGEIIQGHFHGQNEDRKDRSQLFSEQDVLVYHRDGLDFGSILAISMDGKPILQFYKILNDHTFALAPYTTFDTGRTSRFIPSVNVERVEGESHNLISIWYRTHVQFQKEG